MERSCWPHRAWRPPATVMLATVLFAAIGPVPSAGAQSGGVYVDPDGPPGQEYGIPDEQARPIGTTTRARPGAAPPLFGTGVRPATSRSGVDQRRTRERPQPAGPRGGAGNRGRDPGQEPRRDSGREREPAVAELGDPESTSPLAVHLLTATLVVGVGLIITSLLLVGRRRRRLTSRA